LHAASRWRRTLSGELRAVLFLISYMFQTGFVSLPDLERLELFVLQRLPTLLESAARYMNSHRSLRSAGDAGMEGGVGDTILAAPSSEELHALWLAFCGTVMRLLEEDERGKIEVYSQQARAYVLRRLEKGELGGAGTSYLLSLLAGKAADADPVLMAAMEQVKRAPAARPTQPSSCRPPYSPPPLPSPHPLSVLCTLSCGDPTLLV